MDERLIFRRAQYWTDQGERVLPDTYHICSLEDGAEVPLTRFLGGPVLLLDHLRGAVGFRWRLEPVFCQMLGAWWLVGRHDPSRMAYPLWRLNARNVLAWAWLWTFIAIQEATSRPISWLIIQGVLVVHEVEPFQFRKILTYLLRSGHREQRSACRRWLHD